MGPQCEDGYTKIANELLDALCLTRIPGESMQVFMTIMRKTYGYGKKSDVIALSQLSDATGIVKTHISRAISKLENMNMIVTQKGNAKGTSYGINKNYNTWLLLPKKVTLPKKVIIVTQKGNLPLPKKVNTKERESFKEKKEREMFEICIAWKAYVEMRVKIKKPLTPYAMKLRVGDLIKLQVQGQDPIAVLNQSTAACWQDLYPLKKNDAQLVEEIKQAVAPEMSDAIKRARERYAGSETTAAGCGC
ncbi:replication protein [Oryzomonas sagensis]|uniref:Replication protein n=1 Tax=Oryzomonas sagensis TaxID=2603857 RepID=A0ABQ6TL90_9BACT|nr:replication protein [Oryzomonas sagensis]KAB0668954.1 replication protein [Oryzomonas sagensis]